MAEVEFTARLEQALPIFTAITAGPPGAQGPPGEDGINGTPIVTVPYADWPPASPEPDTLYLRLAP